GADLAHRALIGAPGVRAHRPAVRAARLAHLLEQARLEPPPLARERLVEAGAEREAPVVRIARVDLRPRRQVDEALLLGSVRPELEARSVRAHALGQLLARAVRVEARRARAAGHPGVAPR